MKMALLVLLAVLVIGVSIGGAALIVDEGPQGEQGIPGESIQGERGKTGRAGQRGADGDLSLDATICHATLSNLIIYWAAASMNLDNGGIDFDAELDDFERYC